MKILQVTPYFPPAWAYGGPPRVVYELSRELVRHGHSVTVLTTDACDSQRRAKPSRESVDGIEVRRLWNLSNLLAWKQSFLPVGVARFLRRRLPDFDVVHMHTYRTVQNIIARRYAMRYRIPYVLSAHGSVPIIVRQKAMKTLFDHVTGDRLIHDAQKLVAQSNVERAEYERAGAPIGKVCLVPNGVDPTIFGTLPEPGAFVESLGVNGRKLITYLGRLSPGKGLDDLFLAFGEIARVRPDCLLVVAGPDDGYRDDLVRLARETHISERVKFIGFMATPEKLQLLVDSEVVVYPAAHESFGLVPIEALLCGKPVVVSQDTGCGELIAGARAGFTFSYGNVTALRDALLAALRQTDERNEMIRRGREFIVQQLNWGRIAAEMEHVYESALAGPN